MILHCLVIIQLFHQLQPTHATSDMYWAGDRLRKDREKGAYAYQQLLQQNGWIPLGTDFPVEDISPLNGTRGPQRQ